MKRAILLGAAVLLVWTPGVQAKLLLHESSHQPGAVVGGVTELSGKPPLLKVTATPAFRLFIEWHMTCEDERTEKVMRNSRRFRTKPPFEGRLPLPHHLPNPGWCVLEADAYYNRAQPKIGKLRLRLYGQPFKEGSPQPRGSS